MTTRIKILITAVRARATATGSSEDGVATAFVVIITGALLVMAGLVLDGGQALGAKSKALDEAQEAARAGAQALDVGAFRANGQGTLAPDKAVTAAQSYLAATGDTGTVAVNGSSVTVTVTHIQHTQILSIVGIGSLASTASATATAEQGG
ncbi:Flp pilus assembly protein TadG [Catenulispora sp. GAS73]|uniref:pilus assembly protein TadG-related protein n=1 Tax=Catenulispora sp. GAS73 TaxID=3156269 RepID=UPI0035198586